MFEGRPWNSNTVDLIRLARSHCLLVLHSTFAGSIAQMAAEVRDLSVLRTVGLTIIHISATL